MYVFNGYPHGIKGYKPFDLEHNEVFISRNVVFYESIFPFHKNPPVPKDISSSTNVLHRPIIYTTEIPFSFNSTRSSCSHTIPSLCFSCPVNQSLNPVFSISLDFSLTHFVFCKPAILLSF